MLIPPLFLTGVELEPLVLLLQAFRDALRHSDLSQEKAARWMEMDKSRLSRQLSGEGAITLKRIAKLPRETQARFAVCVLEQLGLPRDVKQAARIALGLMSRKRMAKAHMDAPTAAQERSA